MIISGAVLSCGFNSVGTSTAGVSTPADAIGLNLSAAFTNGTAAANVANQHFSARSTTLAGSSTDTIDIAGGITDAFGSTLTFTIVKGLLVKNTGTVAIEVSGTFVGLGGGTISLPAGGILFLIAPDAAGWAVGAGATDEIEITNTHASTAAKYDLAILGVV